MPLVKVSIEQLEAAQELYNAATAYITMAANEEGVLDRYKTLRIAVDRCKKEYEKHG